MSVLCPLQNSLEFNPHRVALAARPSMAFIGDRGSTHTCAHVCMFLRLWRPRADVGSHPQSLFYHILYGKVSQSIPEFTDRASLARPLVLGIHLPSENEITSSVMLASHLCVVLSI